MPRLLAKKLEFLRTGNNLTKAELARRLALTNRAYISNLEDGDREPSLSLIVQIASVFRVTTDFLLRDSIPVEAGAILGAEPKSTGNALETFGEKLRLLRLQGGMSQKALAEKLGLARRGYISNLEAGRKRPSPELALQISDLFQVTTDYLLRDTVPVESASIVVESPPIE